ncbi:MAG: hypothetical protein IJ736_06500 [Firmicutes bacterium]|nr:hypothetical protein [Bacillota bacterium]
MKKAIFLHTNQNGYEPDQCGRTMTVEELISLLSEFEPDKEVFLKNDDGHTYGNIRESDFAIEEYDDNADRLSILQHEYNSLLETLGYACNEKNIKAINKQLDAIWEEMDKIRNSR